MRHGSGLSNGTVAAIAAPLSALGAVLLAGLLMWLLMARNMAKSKHRALLTGKVMAPGPGPGTTLLVSDIQDSTVLWWVARCPAAHRLLFHAEAMPMQESQDFWCRICTWLRLHAGTGTFTQCGMLHVC